MTVALQVVNLSSCTHRFGTLGAPLGAADVAQQFLTSGRSGYADTKLANCLFAYELQRRLGEAGVQVCVRLWLSRGWREGGSRGREGISPGKVRGLCCCCCCCVLTTKHHPLTPPLPPRWGAG